MAPARPPATDSVSGFLALWICGGLAAGLILSRLALRKLRGHAFTPGDAWVAVALVFNGLRMVCDYYTNKYGTPLGMAVLHAAVPTSRAYSAGSMTAQKQSDLILAGKLMVVARISIVVVLWSLKMAVLDMLKTLLRKIRCERMILGVMYTALASTFLATILSVYLECNDFKLNWTLFPDAEKCSYDAAWIITYEMGNIITDTLLFFFLVFLIFRASISARERIRLSIFGLSVVLIAVEILRLVDGLPFTDSLLNRVAWGSIEVAIAAAVATLPTIYVLLRPRSKDRPKKRGTTTKKDPGRSAVVANPLGDVNHRASSPQHEGTWDSLAVWDGSTSTEIDAHNDTHKLVSCNSIRGSISGPVSLDGGNSDTWPIPRQACRNAFLTSRPCSRASAMMEAIDDDHDDGGGDAGSEWNELEETDTRAEDVSSPELDELETCGGIFVATEISREVHRVWWDHAQRPRIVTIPPRAKVDRSPV
ncbi:hypothetical protein F5Y14DRAFT_450502 [Nemania sp. NC0429]|nr:hypothetical protein F5Y14DRAFT_450502 [Nemania sp. NC0429]